MRTTLSIDEDVLEAARELASHQKRTIGQVISDLTRQSLKPAPGRATMANGVPVLPSRADAKPVTLEMVNRLRDELGE